MIVSLIYGRRYRAVVAIPEPLRPMVTPAGISAQLARYQLTGAVSNLGGGRYQVDATYGGRTGTYDLPAVVQSVDLIR